MKRIIQTLGFIGLALIIMFFGEYDTNQEGEENVNSKTEVSILRKDSGRRDSSSQLYWGRRYMLQPMREKISDKRKHNSNRRQGPK